MARRNPNLPTPVTINSCIQLSVVGVVEGQFTYNAFYYEGADGTVATVADLFAAATAFWALVGTDYLAAVSADWTLDSVLARNPANPALPSVEDATHNGDAGTGPAGHLPTTDAVVISKYTNTGGQHGRGRIYVPAVPTAWVTLSKVSVPAAYTALSDVMLLPFTSEGNEFNPVVVQRSPAPPHDAAYMGLIQRTLVRGVIATQRRRRLGKGI